MFAPHLRAKAHSHTLNAQINTKSPTVRRWVHGTIRRHTCLANVSRIKNKLSHFNRNDWMDFHSVPTTLCDPAPCFRNTRGEVGEKTNCTRHVSTVRTFLYGLCTSSESTNIPSREKLSRNRQCIHHPTLAIGISRAEPRIKIWEQSRNIRKLSSARHGNGSIDRGYLSRY